MRAWFIPYGWMYSVLVPSTTTNEITAQLTKCLGRSCIQYTRCLRMWVYVRVCMHVWNMYTRMTCIFNTRCSAGRYDNDSNSDHNSNRSRCVNFEQHSRHVIVQRGSSLGILVYIRLRAAQYWMCDPLCVCMSDITIVYSYTYVCASVVAYITHFEH